MSTGDFGQFVLLVQYRREQFTRLSDVPLQIEGAIAQAQLAVTGVHPLREPGHDVLEQVNVGGKQGDVLKQGLHAKLMQKVLVFWSFTQAVHDRFKVLGHNIGNDAILNPKGFTVDAVIQVIDDRSDSDAAVGPNFSV